MKEAVKRVEVAVVTEAAVAAGPVRAVEVAAVTETVVAMGLGRAGQVTAETEVAEAAEVAAGRWLDRGRRAWMLSPEPARRDKAVGRSCS